VKALLTLLLCLAAGLAHAQVADSVKLPIDPDTKRITYAEVVQMPGMSQAELYTRAKLWFAEAFKSAKDVVQADEKDAGLVQGEAWSPMQAHFMGKNMPASNIQLWYTVKLACREGRYRYEITDFKYKAPPTPQFPNVPPPKPMEEVIALWTKPAAKNGKPTKADMVRAEMNETVATNGTGLAASIKTSMARKPGSPASGKDW
jgi:hypothetical protein